MGETTTGGAAGCMSDGCGVGVGNGRLFCLSGKFWNFGLTRDRNRWRLALLGCVGCLEIELVEVFGLGVIGN